MEALTHPFRHAWRRLTRTPAASLLAVIAMGLGIGLTATMFSAVYGVALRGLPFPDSDRLVHVEYVPTAGGGTVEVSIHDFRDWQAEQRSLVVIGYEIFQKRFGSDPSVVGRTIRVNGEPANVIGVMGEGFQFPIRQDVWVPLRFDRGATERGEGITLEVFGRLRDGVRIEEAEAEL